MKKQSLQVIRTGQGYGKNVSSASNTSQARSESKLGEAKMPAEIKQREAKMCVWGGGGDACFPLQKDVHFLFFP